MALAKVFYKIFENFYLKNIKNLHYDYRHQ
jgi:hypothetical protein